MDNRIVPRALLVVMGVFFFMHFALHAQSVATTGERPSLIYTSYAFAFFGIAHACYILGWRRGILLFVCCAVLSTVSEITSLKTGDVGAYYYTDVLGPQFFGFPYVMPFAWFMMVYPSFIIANLVVYGRYSAEHSTIARLIWASFLTGVILTAWDLAMDPYMVNKVGAWVWVEPETGPYPYWGIPWLNFVGWVEITVIINVAYRIIERRLPLKPMGNASRKIVILPVVVYAIWGLVCVIDGYPEATRIIPIFAMGIPFLAGLSRLLEDQGNGPESIPQTPQTAPSEG